MIAARKTVFGYCHVAFLAVSAIRQKDLRSAVGGALQHAIVMRYILEDNQMEQGVTGATLDTQEDWALCGIPLWLSDSDRGHKGHQKVHTAEAAREQIVADAPVDNSEYTATKTAPTLPKMKKTAEVVPSRGTAAEKRTASSSRKQAKEKEKESDKAEGTDNEDADEEDEEEDLDQVLETKQKQKQAPTCHVDASPDHASKDRPKKKSNTVASAEFKPPSRSGPQPSHGTVASASGGGSVARGLSTRLAKVAAPEKK